MGRTKFVRGVLVMFFANFYVFLLQAPTALMSIGRILVQQID